MSAAEHQVPKMSSQSEHKPLTPPQRPSLLKPPARPQRPSVEPSEPDAISTADQENSAPTSPAASPVAAKLPEKKVVSEKIEKAEPETPPSAPKQTFTNHPIAPPSEPMQYRAIGLIRGTYEPSEKQLNRGRILAEDGAIVDAVLLGRVTSLIKKHIDLEQPHLWVVYPRTRQMIEGAPEEEAPDGNLHLQIVGVWEPETLGMPGENPNTGQDEEDELGEAIASEVAEVTDSEATEIVPDAETAAIAETSSEAPDADSEEQVAEQLEDSVEDVTVDVTEAAATDAVPDTVPDADNADDTVEDSTSQPIPSNIPSENYFSIRGEVLNYDEDEKLILVKIVQGAKRNGKPPKAFKLHVSGEISGKTVGYFWDLEVERQADKLVLIDCHTVGIVPPKKKKKGKPFGVKRGRRPGPNTGSGSRPKPSPAKQKPRIRPSAPVKSNPL